MLILSYLEKHNIIVLKRILLIRMVFLVWIIFFLNFIASKLYLYSLVWWFDMPMHFIGGIFLAFLCFWFFLKFNFVNFPGNLKKIIIFISFSVLFIGILWELFEIGNNVFITLNKLNILDTISDLFFDISGGLFGIFYTLKKAQRFVLNKNIEV